MHAAERDLQEMSTAYLTIQRKAWKLVNKSEENESVTAGTGDDGWGSGITKHVQSKCVGIYLKKEVDLLAPR